MDKPACIVCGNPTRGKGKDFCSDCWKKKESGEIVQCEKCGKWHEKDKPCECEQKEEKAEEKNGNCVVCGEATLQADFKLCRDCYYEKNEFRDSMSTNKTIHEYRDYYYNLKDVIMTMKDLPVVKRNCNKLIAIAEVAEYLGDESLTQRVYRDIPVIIENKKKIPAPSPKIEIERKENDEKKEKTRTSQDGHILKSDAEVAIDDVLYNNYILHCYEKDIDEITEKRKKCDWFIPIQNNAGIYIEYWGMTTPEYEESRKEKEELYQKYNLPYISIEKDDWRSDTQTFTSNLIRQIREKAIQYYGYMPKWKP